MADPALERSKELYRKFEREMTKLKEFGSAPDARMKIQVIIPVLLLVGGFLWIRFRSQPPAFDVGNKEILAKGWAEAELGQILNDFGAMYADILRAGLQSQVD